MSRRRCWTKRTVALFALVVVAACGSSTVAVDQKQGNAGADDELVDNDFGNPPLISPAVDELWVESWSTNNAAIWDEAVYAPFSAQHQSIVVGQSPSQGADYNDTVRERLEAGTAGDIITCRAFDHSLELFEAGHLVDLSSQEFLNAFDPEALQPWQTRDRAKTFCVPVASVSHTFYFNRDAVDELGHAAPESVAEMLELTAAIGADGRYLPVAFGTATRSRAVNAVLQTLGPAYWGTEPALNLIEGTSRLDDGTYIDLLTAMDALSEYLPEAYDFMTNAEARRLFLSGEAVIYPGGSWELGLLQDASFDIGVFALTRQGDDARCAVIEHPDFGFGINPQGDVENALVFLNWVASADFVVRYVEAFPGSFAMSRSPYVPADPVAAELDRFRTECDTSLRLSLERLAPQGHEPGYTLRDGANDVIEQVAEPEEVARRLQAEFESWAPSSQD